MTMVKSKFGFFQVQIERMLGNAVKLCHPPLGIARERFNAVDMPFSIGKLILTMMYPKVLIETNIYQSIGMNHRAGF